MAVAPKSKNPAPAKAASKPKPEIVAPASANRSDRRVLISEPNGAAAEAIRVLRTRVQSQHIHAGRRALAICGPSFEVGSTFVAVNLAIALAQIGIKALLVDADLREPAVHTYFPNVAREPGLFECLIEPTAPISEFTREDVVPNLDIMFAGAPDAAAHELLAGERFADVVNTCVRDYDITILDTPPANNSADGLRIAAVVGFALIVARKHRSLVADLRTLAADLEKEGVRPIGTVLNVY
jgi:capsular exopolysaccharide synthesis family protein